MTDILPQPDCSLKAVCESLEHCCLDQLEEPGSKRMPNTGARLWGRVRSKLLRHKVLAGAGWVVEGRAAGCGRSRDCWDSLCLPPHYCACLIPEVPRPRLDYGYGFRCLDLVMSTSGNPHPNPGCLFCICPGSAERGLSPVQVDSAWLPPEYKLAEIEVDRQPHWISLSRKQPSTG